jgi:hypothetical protein
MATTNKDFKVKYGLVVEGASALVNGNQVLTQDASDAYILGLTGGATLVKSVSNEFDVSAGGELSIDRATVDAYYDEAGSALTSYMDSVAYADGLAVNYDASGAAAAAQAAAEATAATDATNKANAAQAAAEGYADNKINDASSASDKAWSAYKTSTEIGLAQAAAEGYADDAVAALVNGAPELLDTLNELAAAIGDDENYATTISGLIADKQNNLTAGSNIDITSDVISVTGLDSADISDFNTAAVTANTGLWDTTGAASAAQTAAEGYASGLDSATNTRIDELDTDDVAEGSAQYFTDVRAKTSAADLLTSASLTNITITGTGAGLTITAENGVADSDTDDLTEGTSNLYFTDERAVDALEAVVPNFTSVEINSIAKQIASTVSVATASQVTAYEFLATEYRSAKFLVKTAYGSHTELTEVLLTLDQSNNIAITEYATVGTNGSSMTVTADYVSVGETVRLRVTTLNNTSVVTVVGTLLA